MQSTPYTIYPMFVDEQLFSSENIAFLQDLITREIAKHYNAKKVVVSKEDIKTIAVNEFQKRVEPLPQMNQRIVHNIVQEFFDFSTDVSRKNDWMLGFRDVMLHEDRFGIKPYETPKLRPEHKQRKFQFRFTNIAT